MGAAAAARVESQTVPNMLLLQETFVKIVSPKDHPKVIMSVKIFLHFLQPVGSQPWDLFTGSSPGFKCWSSCMYTITVHSKLTLGVNVSVNRCLHM